MLEAQDYGSDKAHEYTVAAAGGSLDDYSSIGTTDPVFVIPDTGIETSETDRAVTIGATVSNTELTAAESRNLVLELPIEHANFSTAGWPVPSCMNNDDLSGETTIYPTLPLGTNAQWLETASERLGTTARR